MIDLRELSGLELYLKDDYQLGFHNPSLKVAKETRYSTDMTEVLKDSEAGKDKQPLYHMYRNIGYPADRSLLSKNDLRYDITIMLPGLIGDELTKTKGHYHPKADKVSYPEVYEVIYGQALYLIQKYSSSPDLINECYLVKVQEGEKVVIPPDFGHVTINPRSEPLVMSNWVYSGFDSVYEEYQSLAGGCYYLLDGSPYRTMKNKNYRQVPELEKVRPLPCPDFNLEFGKPMYQTGLSDLSKLSFLKDPAAHQIAPKKVLTNI